MYNVEKETHNQILSSNQYAFALAVAQGESHVDAYERIYCCSRDTAAKNAIRLLRKEKIQNRLEEIRAADKLETTAIRAELIADLLADSRNEALPARDRIAARSQLSKICGLDNSCIKVGADSSLLAAILREASEPLVRDPHEQQPHRGRPPKMTKEK